MGLLAGKQYGPAVVGAVLTGQLDDGSVGLMTIKDRGGTTVVQDPREAVAPSMPLSAMRHVGVDHCCRLHEMAALFVDLASDDPPSVATRDLGKLAEVENRIAEGVFNVADWWQLEQMSIPSGLNCPDCRSALYEIKDPRLLRFRCRSGHAYSAESLLSGLEEARERHLSSIFGALIEEATLAKRVRAQPGIETDSRAIENLDFKTQALEREAGQICGWLHEMTGLVEPEPHLR